MTKLFYASTKKLKKRCNIRLFLINILPITIALTLFLVVWLNKNHVMPIAYYYCIFVILTCTSAYSFVTVFIGSLISTRRLKYNKLHTYVEIHSKSLLVSKYCQSVSRSEKMIVYKKLWVVNLANITDIYYYKNNIVVMAPTRLLYEQSDWLTYTHDKRGIKFDKWWYDTNGGKPVNGVKIRDMFSNPKRIARTIQNVSGKIQINDAERKKFREHMLRIAGNKK